MNIETGRFGVIEIRPEEKVSIPNGILGFPDHKEFCLVDPGDDTLILWLQSVTDPNVAFAVLEPKIFESKYRVQLSAAEMRELKLDGLKDVAVLAVLTIPDDITLMNANLKAPIIINLKQRLARQIVLQENIFSMKHLMFKELKAHLMTIQSAQGESASEKAAAVQISALPSAESMLTQG